MKNLLLLMLAGAAGSGARYGLTLWIQHGPGARFDFPLGTLLINVAGSFLLSLLTFLAFQKMLAPDLRLILGTGFCGAFTTFSTFELEADELLRRAPTLALLYLIGNLALGYLAVLIGRWAALHLAARVAP